MATLRIVRMLNLIHGECAICGERALHMHIDLDINRGEASRGLVCEDCAALLRASEIQLRAWLDASPETISQLAAVNASHYRKTHRHWNSPN